MPTSGEEPCRTALPWAAAASTAGSQIAPPSTRTMPRVGSAIAVPISEVRTMTTSSRPWAASGPALWPVLCGATRRPALGGDADDGGDLGGGAGEGDRGRALVDGDVPGQAGGVVPGVAGQVDAAVEQAAQGVGGGDGGRCGARVVELDGHGGDSCVGVIGGMTMPTGTWSRL